MQRPNEAKRRQILAVAARLFSERPFHEVRLEDVAEEASVGKGTLYVYFESKDDLYLTLVREGFARMVAEAEVAAESRGSCVWERLRAVVAGLIRFGTAYPDLFWVMRSGTLTPNDAELQRTRRRLTAVVEGVLREGHKEGEVDDPHPEITAQFVLSFVRGAILYRPKGMTPAVLEEHVLRVLRRGVGAEVAR